MRPRQVIAPLIFLVVFLVPFAIFFEMIDSSNLTVVGEGWVGVAVFMTVVAALAALYGPRIRKWATES
jgi:hypothetical protein